ncbi:MAG: hypothetical protein PHW52_00535 [Candidatus Pacebacteria bacterium]|nr:hypothetical protein [Candidatus Paceibacterota bacterium]
MIIKQTKIIYLGILLCLAPVFFVEAGMTERRVIGAIYDHSSLINTTETWFSCPYTKILGEQFALYKSMEHVNWISINKIRGRGNYCIGGEGLENPGIIQKIDLWRQRLKTYMIAEELRPYYDSQENPKNSLDDRADESRMALLDWLFTTRMKMDKCVTGYRAAYKENLAKIRLFGCQEGMTATNAQGYRITPEFPYPVNKNGPNCFPLNAEYMKKIEKEMCERNMNLLAGCQKAIGKQSYVDDFYCTSGRQQTTK